MVETVKPPRMGTNSAPVSTTAVATRIARPSEGAASEGYLNLFTATKYSKAKIAAAITNQPTVPPAISPGVAEAMAAEGDDAK